jgi:hypothetical protein
MILMNYFDNKRIAIENNDYLVMLWKLKNLLLINLCYLS